MTTALNTSTLKFRTIDGLKIRYAESDDREDHALLLSPWPETLFAFDRVWPRLSARTHLIAVDLPGFGHSEKRDDLLSPQAMGDFIVRLADAFELDNPHVVAPDIGTSASLFAAARAPGRFRSLVIGGGGAAVPLNVTAELKEVVEDPDWDSYFRVDGREIAGEALAGINGYTIPDAINEDYLSAYEGTKFAESMRFVRLYPEQLPVLSTLLSEIKTPVLHIAGRHDRYVPNANSEFLHERLPHSKLDIIDAGHFNWEEAPDEYASLVESWWHEGHAKV